MHFENVRKFRPPLAKKKRPLKPNKPKESSTGESESSSSSESEKEEKAKTPPKKETKK